jgi:hypothetical protein
MQPIVRLGEYAQYPLLYPGKTFALPRLDDQMEMITHYGKIFDPERIPLFGFRDHIEEQRLHAR